MTRIIDHNCLLLGAHVLIVMGVLQMYIDDDDDDDRNLFVWHTMYRNSEVYRISSPCNYTDTSWDVAASVRRQM